MAVISSKFLNIPSIISVFALFIIFAWLTALPRQVRAGKSAVRGSSNHFTSTNSFNASVAPPVGNIIVVNSTADAANSADGLCTLREAITAANSNAASGAAAGECAAGSSSGSDTVDLTGVSGAIALTTVLPAISSSVTLNGPGASVLTVQRATVFGTPLMRIFEINAGGVAVNISGLTISNALLNDNGGGIYSNGATLTVTDCALRNNGATRGGGIYLDGGTATITNTTVDGNSTTGSGGGGIRNVGGSLNVVNSTISRNAANQSASGDFVYGGGIASDGAATLTNSTVSGNTATNGADGIINSGTISLASCTVFNVVVNNGTANIQNSIFHDSRNGTPYPALFGTFNSQDYNLINDTSNATFTGTTAHNITGVDPKLRALQSNGGPTQTMALMPDSPAIDAGQSNLTSDQRGQPRPVDSPLVTNAAGGNGSDIGAYEAGAYIQVNSTADTDDGSCDALGTGLGNHDCTLREAIALANSVTGSETISFATALTSGGSVTINLSTPLPEPTSMTINGPGALTITIQRSSAAGTPNFRILNINSSNVVAISGLTLANGHAPDGSGSASGESGGAILNAGTLTLSNSVISGNRSGSGLGSGPAGRGGGISNSGTLQIIRSTITNNQTGSSSVGDGSGAGIFNSGGTLVIVNSTVDHNHTGSGGGFGGGGGGLSIASGDVTVINATLSGNSAGGSGGAVTTLAGTTRLNRVTITHNRSDVDNSGGDRGGGVFAIAGTITMTNTLVADNFRGTGSTRDDLFGDFSGSTFDLVGDGTGATGITNGGNGNQVGNSASPINPLLTSLGNYGGTTQTHALLPGSPAINAGNNASLPADTFDLDGNGNTSEPLPIDQRGASLTFVSPNTTDIGSYEARNLFTTVISGSHQSATVNASFSNSLVGKVFSSWGDPIAGGLVTFTAPASGPSATFGGSPTVTVMIDAFGVVTSPAPVANGTPGGPYNVTITGANIFSSEPFSLTNSGTTTSTSVTSSTNPSDFGENVTFTATVTATIGTPGGSVDFRDGANDLGQTGCVAGGGNSCTAQLTTSALSVGTHSITAVFNGGSNFPTSIGALAGGQVVRPRPSLSIDDVSASEGDSGTKNFVFTVTLSAASHLQVKADVATANGTATSGSDYQSNVGSLIFNPGDTSKQITVFVNGDPTPEPNETFFVNLSNPVNATISRSQGVATILDDDTLTLLLEDSGRDPSQAAAVESILLLRDPFHVQRVETWLSLGADLNTRVIVFALNLKLNSGEPVSAVVVNLVDINGQSYDVAAEAVQMLNSNIVEVVFRLPDNLPPGRCLVTLKLHGQTSNTGVIRIAS